MGVNAPRLVGRSEWLLDERGRSLRATSHGTVCIGTVRLAGGDAARLIGLLAPAVERWADAEIAGGRIGLGLDFANHRLQRVPSRCA